MTKANCEHCGVELKPAPARWDGEATFVGFIPCACQRPIMTKEIGVVYPGEEDHKIVFESKNYSINDIL